jgi:membrane protease YdiL (CAAX protease family)
MARFIAELDRISIIISVAALVILLYFGISNPEYFRAYWVAYAFWLTGFFGSITLGLTRRSKTLSLQSFISTAVITGLIITSFYLVNYGFAALAPQDIIGSDKLIHFANGVAEELFFGIFLLGLLINWIGFPPLFAVIVSAGVHALYHVPNWGYNPTIMLFFVCFTIARVIYLLYPKAGILLGAHGLWNLVVG